MRRPFVSTAILCMILVSSSALIFSPAAAADYGKVGVKAGDFAVYSAATTNSSIFGNYSSVVVLFTNVTGVVVTLNATGFKSDGSKVSSVTLTGNVTDSMVTMYVVNTTVNMPILYGYLIPTNLSANDPIFYGAPLTINRTTTMLIGGYNRTVNNLNYTVEMYSISEALILYWDKLTGILVKSEAYISGTGWINQTLTFASMWMSRGGLNPPDYTWETLLGIGGIIAIVALCALAWSRTKGRVKGQPPQQVNEAAT
jgi:hypothetical protein